MSPLHGFRKNSAVRTQFLNNAMQILPKFFTIAASILTVFSISATGFDKGEIGRPMPDWTPGTLDIHAVNTGQGECTMFVLPDGTTMLLDAGECRPTTPNLVEPKPDSVTPPYVTYARYAKDLLRQVGHGKLDYIVVSHFHTDHIGEVKGKLPKAENGAYRLVGIAGVGHEVPFSTLIDRAWPDYTAGVAPVSKSFPNYLAFARWQRDNKGVNVERFTPGSNSQLALRHNPSAYPDFEIRNIAANGVVWTGRDTLTRAFFPDPSTLPDDVHPGENECSAAFRISYGPFDYFTGGDLPALSARPWMVLEKPVGDVVGPVEAMKSCHHMNYDSMGIPLLSALRPQVIVVHTRKAQQPDIEVLRNIQSKTRAYPGEVKDVYSTNMHFATPYVAYPNTQKIPATQGHIVIRVLPGGKQFYVYSLSDVSPGREITSIHGPYTSH